MVTSTLKYENIAKGTLGSVLGPTRYLVYTRHVNTLMVHFSDGISAIDEAIGDETDKVPRTADKTSG